MSNRTEEPIRKLSVDDLGLDEFLKSSQPPATPSSAESQLRDDDEVLVAVEDAIDAGFAGVILAGPPGTSKSWYAEEVANRLVDGDATRTRSLQFHPSFQYEDFVEGFVPNGSGGFDLVPKHLKLLCEAAEKRKAERHVLIIDEISRCDAARVFGEALTYIETTKREKQFYLSSGSLMSIPRNIFILATMNPWDRGVDEMDVALDRRFAHVDMPPRTDLLEEFLTRSKLSEEKIGGVVSFFEQIQKHPNPMCHIGHAYFSRIATEENLRQLWRYQLRHVFGRVFRHEPEEMKRIESLWWNLVEKPQAEPVEAQT